MIINHNIPALNAYRMLMFNNTNVSRSLEKLSSGLRINRAADDAAGLVISEKMRAQIKGIDQATRNAQDGISMIQTAEGALAETHSILQRMRELSVQAANDTYTSSDRVAIQEEVNQLRDEVNRIANTTEFNTKKLLDGSTSALVSTDKLTTKVFMRDGLRVVDQFGQKAVGGGNYKLAITAEVGAAQVQKTDLMRIKHAGENTVSDSNTGYSRFDATLAGILSGSATFQFVIDGQGYSTSAVSLVGARDTQIDAIVAGVNGNASTNSVIRAVRNTANASFTLERIDAPDKSFTFNWAITSVDGVVPTIQGEGVSATANGGATVASTSQNIKATTIDQANFFAGDYKLDTALTAQITAAANLATATLYQQTTASATTFKLSSSATVVTNASLLMEVASKSGNNITYNYKWTEMSAGGVVTSGSGTVVLVAGGSNAAVVIGSNTYADMVVSAAGNITVGDKVLIDSVAGAVTNDSLVIAHSTTASHTIPTKTYQLTSDGFNNQTKEFKYFQMDTNSASSTYGQTKEAKISIQFDVLRDSVTPVGLKDAAAFTIKAGDTIGSLANLNSKLYDVEKFWDANGNFLLENPQTITMVQGDGKQASFTLFGSDTVQNVIDKMNSAIGVTLGQNALDDVGQDTDKYVSYVTTAASSGLEAVAGTFVIRSAMTGRAGELNFVGDDAVLNALSLTTIQKTAENKFTVDVTEAHLGTVIASDYKIEGNNLIGVINANVDVQFDGNTGVKATWNATNKTFDFTAVASGASTFVHIADRSTVLQVGANPMQDMSASIGNMTASSLGIDNIQVTSNPLANRAIRTLDKAIGAVSGERAKLGAVQNRLDHTINSLGASYENLVAAESRIRDVDMAKQMMEFTKYNVLTQAATAMLAQANQLPQAVLQLLR